jgi:hypothetical protein
MTNIFISYNRKSEAVSKALAGDFEELGHTVWFDQELSGGQAWWDQILAMVRRCDLFVFILEPEALNSTACKREYDYATDVGKPILPILVSDGVAINRLPPALSKIQFVDYRKQDRNAAFRLARAIGSVPPPKPLPDPLPPSPEAPISYLGSLTAQVETTSSLTYEQQSTLVFDLKRSLRDPGNEDDARALLGKLRTRRDLFAAIAEEIDEVLGTVRKAPPPVRSSEITPPSPKQSPKKETPSISSNYEPPEEQAAQDSAAQPARTDTDRKPTRRERVKGAFLLALIGVAAGILCGVLLQLRYRGSFRIMEVIIGLWEYPFLLFPLAGAIAGAISGRNRSKIIAALVGMGVAVILVGGLLRPFSDASSKAVVLLLPTLAVLVVEYIKKHKAETAKTASS